MGKLVGLLMIAAGVGTAAYVYPHIGADADQAQRQLSEVVAIAAPQAATQRTAPTIVVAKPDLQASPGAAPIPVATTARPSPAPTTAPATASAPPPAQSAVATLAVAPLTATATAKPLEPPVPQTGRRSKVDDERFALARSIQVELKRVGCFQGDADGTWSNSTRQAMKTFIERVNATLPVDEPDHILKTLVQGHPGNACGRPPVVTQAPVPAKRPADRVAATQQATNSGQIAPVTSPAPNAVVTTEKSSEPGTSSWSTVVTSAAPAIASVTAPATGSLTETKRPADLPGRMAIGAASQPNQRAPTTPSAADTPKTRIVVQPKSGIEGASVGAEQARGAEPLDQAAAPTDRSSRPPPQVGAVAAAAASSEEPRATAPPGRVAASRSNIPPPRYLGAYGPAPRPPSRPKFGPQIFRQLEASGK